MKTQSRDADGEIVEEDTGRAETIVEVEVTNACASGHTSLSRCRC